jgi:ribosome maturation factor RimP
MENSIVDKIREFIAAHLDMMGLQIVEIQYKKGRGKGFLRILIDRKDGGITAAECVEANEKIGLLLDEANLFMESYLLEVSSPGIDRPLLGKEDFERKKGRKVRIETKEDLREGLKEIIGVIVDVEEEAVVIEMEGGEKSKVPFNLIKKAKLKLKW